MPTPETKYTKTIRLGNIQYDIGYLVKFLTAIEHLDQLYWSKGATPGVFQIKPLWLDMGTLYKQARIADVSDQPEPVTVSASEQLANALAAIRAHYGSLEDFFKDAKKHLENIKG